LAWGTETLLDSISEHVQGTEVQVWGREELAKVTKAATGKAYNEKESSTALLVNSRARPGSTLRALAAKKTPFVAIADDGLVAARAGLRRVSPGLITQKEAMRISKGVPRIDSPPELLFCGYWDLVSSNGLAIAEQAQRLAEPLSLPPTARVMGPPSSLHVHGSVEVEDYVCFDSRAGPIVVAEEASIESFSRISGPCYIGRRAKILTALVRGGTSIFEGCKVGGEVENSIIMPYTNKAHSGYVGDSYVGEWVNLGAGSTFSNLKNTYGNVRTMVNGTWTDTGLLKLGPAIGDMAKVSIGATVFAGKKVGAGSQVTGLAASDIPSFTYFDGLRRRAVEIRLASVIETQRRMKERRGLTLNRAEEELITLVFHSTSAERRGAGARKGRIF
jgi:UDP-N-acetylglucosamine diphosphorylase/glucosamine-1-phosphate N-acetyltransferase